jgi:hypothetical protein
VRRKRNRITDAAFCVKLDGFHQGDTPMPMLRATLFTACLLGSLSAAQAGSEPAAACAFAGQVERTSDLVLGHFRGGKIIRAADGVPLIVWKDEYSCFTSRRVCEAWKRRMDIAYRNVDGDRTCLPIR